ncbi:3-keto-5-aminohexanoate cleavage enzyme [Halanaerobium saccharolyticum subsp. saccharolyticum DSM 6643]|uniref:3-keto-5-aminohexanoate cleavage enzyme n=1 Tax=Halanaerobium saccharolyticum subsp. saccharolyticum DSM 6643 TaxID=1293054 RepID=M5DY37_9FIRM|nr:3-keto-5-aminohexanoate cleavage protein [Halanaerobium saccharolyticum]CCU77855.1 3-keto-5-aminohexanoate cleavage enzyme [Halanaerobium saccharolyticum subsp. saccharolyticum DSM 6643]
MDKLIITAALTGAEVTKEIQPNLPITAEEIAVEAEKAYEAGAAIVHVHAREDNGSPTQDIEYYKSIKEEIGKRCPVIFQPSTGGATWHTAEERLQPVDLKPEMATLSTGTCNFGDDVFMNSKEYIVKFAKKMKENRVKPEIEVFEPGMIANAEYLIKNDLVSTPLHFDFVLGVPGAMPASAKNLVFMVGSIPAGSTWTVAGIGRHETPLAMMGIAMGGHVRVGFEDNIYYKKGEIAKSNAQLVERVARMANELGREVATPDEAREILNLK